MSKPLLLIALVALCALGIALAALVHPDLWIPPAVAEVALVCWWLSRSGSDDEPPDATRSIRPAPRGGLLPLPERRVLPPVAGKWVETRTIVEGVYVVMEDCDV